MRHLFVPYLVLILAAPAPAQTRAKTDGALLAASEGGGTVRLLWMPPKMWPAGGWQVQDDSGKVLAGRVYLGDPEALKALPPGEAEDVRAAALQASTLKTAEERALFSFATFVRAGNEPKAGRALGLACTLSGQAAGNHVYVVVGLDAQGSPTALKLRSAPVDAAARSPLPPAPAGLKLAASREGVKVTWAPVDGGVLPVMDYRMQQGERLLMAKPFILGGAWKEGTTLHLDREAPGDRECEYEVWAVDVFGRRGPSTKASVYYPDPVTLRPPGDLSVASLPGLNRLAWDPRPTAHTASWVVERAYAPEGPFEVLGSLPVAQGSFEDGDVSGGTTYHYRLRSQDALGNQGDPGRSVFAQARSGAAPGAPLGVRAEEGPGRVRLRWEPSSHAVAGYLVERKVDDGAWIRLTGSLVNADRVDDALPENLSGTLLYRVRAVTLDSLMGEPCEPVQVRREDHLPPEAPVIQKADGRDGQVVLTFRPGGSPARSARFLVLRSALRAEGGASAEVVVGDPLPGDARSVTDAWVDAGVTYLYRMAALGALDDRSAFSGQIEVRVGAALVPEPPLPRLEAQSQPYARVCFHLGEPPDGVEVFLHRKQVGEQDWVQILGPVADTEIVDAAPLPGKAQYRLYYRARGGSAGRGGAPAEVELR